VRRIAQHTGYSREEGVAVRILIATTPADGHVGPLVPVVRELVARGHEVRWYTGDAYAQRVRDAGAGHEPMRQGCDFGGRNRTRAFPAHQGLTGLASFRRGIEDIFFATAAGQLADLNDILERFPARVLVADDMCYGASFVRERSDIPLCWVSNSVYIRTSRDTAPLGLARPPGRGRLGRVRDQLLHLVTDQVLLRGLRTAATRARRGCGLDRLAGHGLDVIARPPDLYLVATMPSLEYPRRDLAPNTRFIGPLRGPATRPFTPPPWWPRLRSGRPVVHLTQGTVADDAERLLTPALAALAERDVFAVVTTGTNAPGWPAGPLPDNVVVEPFVPYHELMPHVAVLVTNGGFNGVNTALAHGVPVVVAPASEEKPEVAARISWAGAGLAVPPGSVSQDRLGQAIDTVLGNPAFTATARRIRAECDELPGVPGAADLIEQLGPGTPAGSTSQSAGPGGSSGKEVLR
jgi:MGT family glycosyltransferase